MSLRNKLIASAAVIAMAGTMVVAGPASHGASGWMVGGYFTTSNATKITVALGNTSSTPLSTKVKLIEPFGVWDGTSETASATQGWTFVDFVCLNSGPCGGLLVVQNTGVQPTAYWTDPSVAQVVRISPGDFGKSG
jgi:hypothetical protein